jgi:hypothetical protein
MRLCLRRREFIAVLGGGAVWPQQLGWTVGRNARIEERYASGSRDLIRKYAEEPVAQTPDVTRTSAGVVDPVGDGVCQKLGEAERQRYWNLNTVWLGNGRNC